ncbi:MAG: PEP-CTERM sorting domain-containing protein [Akkermansiaceae bacterium]
MNKKCTSSLILLALASPLVNAASIGINFGSGRNNSALAAGDSAGVVPQANWNNAPGASGNLAVLNGDEGAASGASLTWATDEQWSIGGPAADPNGTLLNGWISANNSNAPDATVSIASIPYATYDLYVYTNHDRATEDVDLTGPFGTFRIHENDTDILSAVSWVQQTATADGDASQAGNYALFSGLTATNLDLILAPAGGEGSVDRGAITGIQIVEVIPEPSSSLLLALAGLIGVSRRRR